MCCDEKSGPCQRCTFAKASPERSRNLEASRRHGREVRTRLVNDRIVSDKTFWNATFSRSLFKNCFSSALRKETKLSKSLKRPQRHRRQTLQPSLLLIDLEGGWVQISSGNGVAQDGAWLSVLSWGHTSPWPMHAAEPTSSAAGAWSNR